MRDRAPWARFRRLSATVRVSAGRRRADGAPRSGGQFFRRGGKVRGRRDDYEGCRHRALELVSARTQAQQDHRTRTRGVRAECVESNGCRHGTPPHAPDRRASATALARLSEVHSLSPSALPPPSSSSRSARHEETLARARRSLAPFLRSRSAFERARNFRDFFSPFRRHVGHGIPRPVVRGRPRKIEAKKGHLEEEDGITR